MPLLVRLRPPRPERGRRGALNRGQWFAGVVQEMIAELFGSKVQADRGARATERLGLASLRLDFQP